MLLRLVILFALIFPVFPVDADAKFHLAGLAVSDIGVEDQWYLDKIKAPDAWEKTTGNKDIVVAVIDVGIDLDHPDLKNNIWTNNKETPDNGIDDDGNGYIDDAHGWNFLEKNNKPAPNLSGVYNKTAVIHGTAVAGIIAAEGNNAFAGAGVAWQVKIMPLKVFDEMGDSDTALVEAAVGYAVENGVDIINMSFVGLGYSPALDQKIKHAYEKGILLVAAAGNESNGSVNYNLDKAKSYPVCFDGTNENRILGVAAVDENDSKAKFSNYGASCVDISAPGTNIASSLYHDSKNSDFDKYFGGKLNGTSMSAPQVTGAAVLIKALHPNYTNKEIMRVLIETADNIDGANPYYLGKLGGRLNVAKAVEHEIISMETEKERNVKYVLAAGSGSEPKVWLLNSKGDAQKEFYAYSSGFRGGVNAALGDVDGDGSQEAVVGAGYGGGPHIRIFNLSGELEYQFFAFDKTRRNGAVPYAADIDGDGTDEIIVAEQKNAKPEVRTFNYKGELLNKIILSESINHSNLNFWVADVNQDSNLELIAAIKNEIKIFDLSGGLVSSFYPFGKYFSGEMNAAVGDLNNDGWTDIIISRQKVGASVMQTFSYDGRLLSPGIQPYAGIGALISAGDRDGDGAYEIISAPKSGNSTELKLWDDELNLKLTLYPFGKNNFKKVSAYIVTRK